MDSIFHSMLGRAAGPSAMGAGLSFGGGGNFPGAFQGAFQQDETQRRRQQEEEETQKAAPPASRKAIRQLPTIVVSPEDLVDENNRECCICLDENNLKDRVIRLPCAHIYHPPCITSWLLKHCTCPVCRYELPTDNPVYEQARLERMKGRKPRYAQYELDRMPVKELRSLAVRLKIDVLGVSEKKDLVRRFVESGRIEIIAAPEPLEYRLSALRGMGVGKLKRAMEEAGVFFDPVDVVEKEDMVQIFVNSGRVVLQEEEESDPMEIEEEKSNSKGPSSSVPEQATPARTAEKEGTAENPIEILSPSSPNDGSACRGARQASSSSVTPPAQDEDDGYVVVPPPVRQENITTGRGEYSSSSVTMQLGGGQVSRFANMSIKQLRSVAREFHVDLSGCLEKGEIVKRLDDAAV